MTSDGFLRMALWALVAAVVVGAVSLGCVVAAFLVHGDAVQELGSLGFGLGVLAILLAMGAWLARDLAETMRRYEEGGQ